MFVPAVSIKAIMKPKTPIQIFLAVFFTLGVFTILLWYLLRTVWWELIDNNQHTLSPTGHYLWIGGIVFASGFTLWLVITRFDGRAHRFAAVGGIAILWILATLRLYFGFLI